MKTGMIYFPSEELMRHIPNLFAGKTPPKSSTSSSSFTSVDDQEMTPVAKSKSRSDVLPGPEERVFREQLMGLSHFLLMACGFSHLWEHSLNEQEESLKWVTIFRDLALCLSHSDLLTNVE